MVSKSSLFINLFAKPVFYEVIHGKCLSLPGNIYDGCSLGWILQGVNFDFGKALNLLDTAFEKLWKLWSDPQKIIHTVAKDECATYAEKKSGNVRYSMLLLTP